MATQPQTLRETFRDRIRPWQCQACGTTHISANKSDCPHCRVPRPVTVAPGTTQSHVITYTSQQDMARGVASMTAQGWQIAGQSSYTPRKGLGRTLAGGLLFFNRKPETVVTYTRVTP